MKLRQYQYPIFKTKVINIWLVMNSLLLYLEFHISWVSMTWLPASQFLFKIAYMSLINYSLIKHYVRVSYTLVSYKAFCTWTSQTYCIIFWFKTCRKIRILKPAQKPHIYSKEEAHKAMKHKPNWVWTPPPHLTMLYPTVFGLVMAIIYISGLYFQIVLVWF